MHIAVRSVPSCGWYRLLPQALPFTTSTTKSTNKMSHSQACPRRFLFVVVCDRVSVEVISPLFLSESTLFELRSEASHFSPRFKLLVMQRFKIVVLRADTAWSYVMLCLADYQIFADVSEEVSASLQGQSP
jgi:hypothetical protein